jgi:hypothetical protein
MNDEKGSQATCEPFPGLAVPAQAGRYLIEPGRNSADKSSAVAAAPSHG